MIIRVFRAQIHDGKQEAFQRFVHETAVPMLRRQPGMVGLQLGRPHRSSPDEFLMVTTWKDLDALRGFTGENWEEPVVAPEERDLVKNVVVHHYESMERPDQPHGVVH